jgi:hypothetical protein
MASFIPLETTKPLGMLNSHLVNESYINGVEATTDDTVVFNALGKEPELRFVEEKSGSTSVDRCPGLLEGDSMGFVTRCLHQRN